MNSPVLQVFDIQRGNGAMDLQDAQSWLEEILNEVSVQFQKVPGSAILLRYIKSSYQNDPVRSAVELFLFLFAVRYLLAPKYSTQKKSYVTLSDEACVPLLSPWRRSDRRIRRLMNSWKTGLRIRLLRLRARSKKPRMKSGQSSLGIFQVLHQREVNSVILTAPQAYWTEVKAVKWANGDEPCII